MENSRESIPITGIGVLIVKDGKVLLGKRKNAHGEGEYAFPGGKLEHMESFEDCARRETEEECGIEIENIRFQFLANLQFYAPKHFTHINLIADWRAGDPEVKEPDKCEHWGWYNPANPPTPLFKVTHFSLEQYCSGVTDPYSGVL